jgi:hypothetical protein
MDRTSPPESRSWGPNLKPSSLKIVSDPSILSVYQSANYRGHKLMSNMNFCALQIFRGWFPACWSLIKEGKIRDHELVPSYSESFSLNVTKSYPHLIRLLRHPLAI